MDYSDVMASKVTKRVVTQPRKIFITRHGERVDFIDKTWKHTAQRRFDPPLSNRGLAQAECVARRLRGEKIAHIFSSPYFRCIQTANATAEALDLPIKVEHGLGEWFGDGSTEDHRPLSTQELKQSFPRVDLNYTSYHTFTPAMETDIDIHLRLHKTMSHLIDKFFHNPDTDGHIMLVGHAATTISSTRGILALNDTSVPACQLLDPNGPNARYIVNAGVCSVVSLDYTPEQEKWRVDLHGVVDHLYWDPVSKGDGHFYNWTFKDDYRHVDAEKFYA